MRWGVGAGLFSPCSTCWWWERYKVLPAGVKRAEMGHFGGAGGVLYRFDPRGLRAGRVLYRHRPRVRYKVLPARFVGGGSGIKFSLLA